MKFLCYYQIIAGKASETRKQWTSQEENFFGMEMVARYHSSNGQQGVVIIETDNPENLASWAMQWDGTLIVDIHPCNDDEGAKNAISA